MQVRLEQASTGDIFSSYVPSLAEAILGKAVQLSLSRHGALQQGALGPAQHAANTPLVIVTHDAVKSSAEAGLTRVCRVAVYGARVGGVEAVAETGVRVEVDTALTAWGKTGRLGGNGNRSRPGDGAWGRHAG